jgi:competence protein ComEC
MRIRLVLCVAMLIAFSLAPMRGVGTRATVLDPLSGARDRVLTPLVVSVPGDAGALAAGLTLGEDRYFSREFRDAMLASATTHLVALSGFNVTLMLGFARRALRTRVSRRQEAWCGIALLAGFVALAGLQPSLVRAALMGSVLMIAGVAGKRVAPARLLLLTAAFMLLVEPRFATHLGFILSFISSWALLAMFGDVERTLATGTTIRKTLRAAVLPSAVAQIGVAPALLATVGSVALVGLLVNPIAVPMTPLLTAVSAAQGLLAQLAPGLAYLTSPAVTLVMLPLTKGITLASRVPLEVAFPVPATVAALLYASTVWWSLRYRPRLW